MTELGQTALQRGAVVTRSQERRAFDFLDGPPARYLPLLRPAGTPFPAPEGWKLDPAVLQTCLRQPEAWKVRHHFPTEVEQLLPPAPEKEPDWREVILVGPEVLNLALVQVPPDDAGRVLLGFVVNPEGWTLDASAPVLALSEGWRDVLPGLTDEPSTGDWKRAWQLWCHPRSLPSAEVDAVSVELAGHRLLVKAPARLVERLRTARSDALKGEAWLLAGSGRSRAAAQIDLSEA